MATAAKNDAKENKTDFRSSRIGTDITDKITEINAACKNTNDNVFHYSISFAAILYSFAVHHHLQSYEFPIPAGSHNYGLLHWFSKSMVGGYT